VGRLFIVVERIVFGFPLFYYKLILIC
jgi:hypothetical protein